MMAPMSDCLFCKIVAGEIPATLVHEDERTIAFMDINPVVRGHLLVVPRAHSHDLTEIDPEDLAATLRSAQALVGKAMRGLGAEGANVVNNCGSAAGQTVFHFHVHVVPRTAGDGFHVPLGGPPGDREEIAAAAEAIRSA
jgi:histidine triad (HIT) family protein